MTEEKKVFTVNDYYKEQSPKKRKKILESLLDQNDGEENQMRRELFGLRYGGWRSGGQLHWPVDEYENAGEQQQRIFWKSQCQKRTDKSNQ